MIFAIIVGFIFCLIVIWLFIEAKNAPTIEDNFCNDIDVQKIRQSIEKEFSKRD